MIIVEVQLTIKVVDKENGGIEGTIYDILRGANYSNNTQHAKLKFVELFSTINSSFAVDCGNQ